MVNFDSVIAQWLRAHPDDRDPAEGARLLLRADRNQVFYRAALASPGRYLPEIETRLRDYIRRRKDTPSPTEAQSLAREADAILNPQPTDPSLGTGAPPPLHTEAAEAAKSGLRPDHSTLPEEIQSIPLANRTLRARMQVWHARIRELAATDCEAECTREEIAELVTLLRDADIRYHRDWQRYDTFTLNP